MFLLICQAQKKLVAIGIVFCIGNIITSLLLVTNISSVTSLSKRDLILSNELSKNNLILLIFQKYKI